jgi:hypothetical protein
VKWCVSQVKGIRRLQESKQIRWLEFFKSFSNKEKAGDLKALHKRHGDCRNRTSDLVHAKHTRYQLRQTPRSTRCALLQLIILVLFSMASMSPTMALNHKRWPTEDSAARNRCKLLSQTMPERQIMAGDEVFAKIFG